MFTGYKYFFGKFKDNHDKRLVMLRYLLLYGAATGGLLYFRKPYEKVRKDLRDCYLSGLTDHQLDLLNDTGSPTQVWQASMSQH